MIKFGRPNKDYLYSINNEHKGFVSISDDCSTGVSRTEYYPFYKDDEDGWYTGLCSLAEMINEAWYHLKNDWAMDEYRFKVVRADGSHYFHTYSGYVALTSFFMDAYYICYREDVREVKLYINTKLISTFYH